MTDYYPLVGIPCDIARSDLSAFHGAGEKYINAVVHGAKVCPILIPAQGPGEDLDVMDEEKTIERLLQSIDGLFLSGSPSNVQPSLYGEKTSLTPDAHDPQRDKMTLAMIRAAIKKKIPILAVCRGMQELNVALGGTLHQKVHLVDGLMDHRENTTLPRGDQYKVSHQVQLAPDSLLSSLVTSDIQMVNSLHGQGINQLGAGLKVEARSPDGLIEAIRLDDDDEHFVLGVQWHPEWLFKDNAFYTAIFKSFGEAVRSSVSLN